MTATESEQVRILRENELAQAENERLKAEWHRLSLDYVELEQERDKAREQADRWVAKLERLQIAGRKASIIIGHIVAEGWEAPDITAGIPNESLAHAELQVALAEGD